MNVMQKQTLLSSNAWKQLRHLRVADWMRSVLTTPGPTMTIQHLMAHTPRPAGSIPIVAPDGKILGQISVELANRYPQSQWSEIQLASIMLPVAESETVSPHLSLEETVKILLARELIPRVVFVASERTLLGELDVESVTSVVRQFEDQAATASMEVHTVHLQFKEPILDKDGRRFGRLARLAVDRHSYRITHVIGRLDGLMGREVVLPADRVLLWNEHWIRTDVDMREMDMLQNFITYIPQPGAEQDILGAPPMMSLAPALSMERHRNIPSSSICLDQGTRLWSGYDSLGRLTWIAIRPETERIEALGYASGLLVRKDHELSIGAVSTITDDRIEVKPAAWTP